MGKYSSGHRKCPNQCEHANLSSIHWDIVLNQCEKWGGGRLWFDDVLVRENGRFVLDELQGLNRE
jgi:aminopeptidase